MKFRDKMIEYFDNIPEGTVVVANAMYDQDEPRCFFQVYRKTVRGWLHFKSWKRNVY